MVQMHDAAYGTKLTMSQLYLCNSYLQIMLINSVIQWEKLSDQTPVYLTQYYNSDSFLCCMLYQSSSGGKSENQQSTNSSCKIKCYGTDTSFSCWFLALRHHNIKKIVSLFRTNRVACSVLVMRCFKTVFSHVLLFEAKH